MDSCMQYVRRDRVMGEVLVLVANPFNLTISDARKSVTDRHALIHLNESQIFSRVTKINHSKKIKKNLLSQLPYRAYVHTLWSDGG